MECTFVQYRFSKNIPMQEVTDSLFLSVLASEGIYGRARIRIETEFSINKRKRVCVINVSTEVGQHVSRIFSTFIAKQFGENSFEVERVTSSSKNFFNNSQFGRRRHFPNA